MTQKTRLQVPTHNAPRPTPARQAAPRPKTQHEYGPNIDPTPAEHTAATISPPPAGLHNFGRISVFPPVQAKLTVGEPNDHYEQEADRVADTVLRMSAPAAPAPPGEDDDETAPTVQTKPAGLTITPWVQRQTDTENEEEEQPVQAQTLIQRQADTDDKKDEEEPVQASSLIQRQELPEEEDEDSVQTKPVVQRQSEAEEDDEEPVQTKSLIQRQEQPEEGEEEEEEIAQAKFVVQRQAEDEEEDEEPLQTKPFIQRQEQSEEEEEETAQTKLIVQRQLETEEEEEEPLQSKSVATKTPKVSSDNENYINSTRGQGQPLPQEERDFFESRFAHNFGRVRIHADGQAAKAARQINAQAFTVGNNIFFGANRYQPGTKTGRQLLAHELTHTIQQTGVRPLANIARPARFPAHPPLPWNMNAARQMTAQRISPVSVNQVVQATPLVARKAMTDEVTTTDMSGGQAPPQTAAKEQVIEPARTSAPTEPAQVKDEQAPLIEPQAANSDVAAGQQEITEPTPPAFETTEEPEAQSEEAARANEENLVNAESQESEAQSAEMMQVENVVAQNEAVSLPSLVDLLGPAEEGAAETDIREDAEYNPEAARTEVQSIGTRIMAASTESQQRIEMQAEDMKADLTSNAETLRQSVEAQVAANVASLRGAFAAERASLEASLEASRAQVDTALEARKVAAAAGGEAARARLTNLFTQHRTNIETTVQDNVAAAEEMRTKYATEVHERTQAQAAEARRRGQANASSYPNTERGRVQANAARSVANETAQEIEERKPEAVEAIEDVISDIPEQFQEKGQEALDGFDDGLPGLLVSVDQQVQAVTNALNEQATQAYQQLNTLGSQVREQLDTLETAAVARAEAVGPQVEARIDSRLESVQTQIDTATLQAIEQVSQLGDEASQVLLNIETPDVAASHEFATQIQSYMTGIADTAGNGLQQSGDLVADEFQQAEAAISETLQGIEQQTTDELQTMSEASNTTLSGLVASVDESFGEALLSLDESFTETESQVEENLSQAVDELAVDFGQALQDAEEEIINAVDEGLSKNDEALDLLGPQMQEAADDAAWDYDHPILSTLASIGAIVAGVIVGIVAFIVVVVVVILLAKVILAAVAFSAILTAVVKVALVVGGLALLAYGVYEAYQERIRAGEEGGWATFGKALLDFAGITDLYRAITTPGLSPWERFVLAAVGTFKLAGTVLLVYGAWRFVATGGLRGAWRGLWQRLSRLWRQPRVRPGTPVRRPVARHNARSVTQRTVAKSKNTVIEPGVDVAGDVAAINAGKATRVGNTYIINGRTYGVEPNGTLYPISGPGFHPLNRGAFKALGVYNKFKDTSRAAEILDAMGISSADRNAALQVWRSIQGG